MKLPNSYLEAAEHVLAMATDPMSAAEILAEAKFQGLISDELYGRRQDRTLQARLSEDIAKFGERSRFFRTAPGQYYLRALKKGEEVGEYFAKPRRKELPAGEVLTMDADLARIFGDEVCVPYHLILDQLSAGNYRYNSVHPDHEHSGTPINSFLVVHDTTSILSFRCGKFFPRTDPLFGQRSIGLGGAVLSNQLDLLYENHFGIVGSAVEELEAGIGLPRKHAEEARYKNKLQPHWAVLTSEPEREKHVIHLVLSYHCPSDFRPSKAALSVNNISWLDANAPPNNLSDFDTTSQYIFEKNLQRNIVSCN